MSNITVFAKLFSKTTWIYILKVCCFGRIPISLEI
uniref:Uncharacterized protein n=1 Tax=Anguilla anguilla TaxID=7936 RepID=A0A0E9VTI8_ANGAN